MSKIEVSSDVVGGSSTSVVPSSSSGSSSLNGSIGEVSDQAKQLVLSVVTMQETIHRLTETVTRMEEENKQLKTQSKILQKRANQATARPSLALSLSFGSTQELFGSSDNNKNKGGDLSMYRSNNLLAPGNINLKAGGGGGGAGGGAGGGDSNNSSGNNNTNNNNNRDGNNNDTSEENKSAGITEFEQYLNATEVKQAMAEMAKCKNLEQRQQTVWANVCKFCKKSQPTKAIGYLSLFGKEYDINYRNMEEDGMTLLHVVCNGESASVLVLRFILTYFSNVNVWSRTKSNGSTAMDLASICQQQECMDALLAYSTDNDYISKEWKDVFESTEKWQDYQSIIETFDEYLKKNGGNVMYEKFMQYLEECLIRIIEDKKAIPMQIFYLVWNYHKNTLRIKKAEYFEQLRKYQEKKGKDSKRGNAKQNVSSPVAKPTKMKYTLLETKLWKAVKEQLVQVLDWQSLYRTPTQWYWFECNFLNNPIWFDIPEEKLQDEKEKEKETKNDENETTIMCQELYNMAKAEMSHGSNLLEQAMKGLIEENEKSEQVWQKIVNYQYKNPLYSGKNQMRQDCIPDGLQCDMEAVQLQQISLMTKSFEYDAKYEYDYNVYVSELGIRAHSLNAPFQDAIQSLFKEQINNKGVKYLSGPVKSVKRVREKAYTLYRDCEFPTAAHVLDIVRCCLSFPSVEELWKGIEVMAGLTGKDDASDTGNTSLAKITLLRCLNQCAEMKKGKHYRETTGKSKLPIPAAYVDLKFNVIISVEQKDNDAVGIVGEVMFVLKPMFDFQKRSSELVQVMKMKEKIEKSREICLPFEKRLRIAGTNERLLAQLLVKESHHFTENCIRAKDVYGKTLLTRFFQNKDTPADLIGKYVECIPKSLMTEVWKAKIDAGRSPLMLVLQYHNADVIEAVLKRIPTYLRDELFKEKNNDGWTSLMLATRYQSYDSIKAILPYIPKDPSLWQSTSTKGLHVLHCICQNENEDAHKSLTALLEVMPEHLKAKLITTANKDGKKAMYYATLKANQKNGTSAVIAQMFPNEAAPPKQ